MEKLCSGLYRCKVCHAILNLPASNGEPPLSHLAASGGGPLYRVVTMGGVSVHRCEFPPEQAGRNGFQSAGTPTPSIGTVASDRVGSNGQNNSRMRNPERYWKQPAAPKAWRTREAHEPFWL